MNILFITPRIPYPPIKGDSLRTFYFIKELAKRHSIDLLTFHETGEDLNSVSELKKYCNSIELVHLSKLQSYINAFKSFINFRPFQINYYYSNEMNKRLKLLLENKNYDIVHVVLHRMMQYAPAIGRERLVLDSIDALSLNMKRRASVESNPFKKAVFYLEYISMKKYEKYCINKCKASLVTSQVDKSAIGDEKMHVISNGVDTQYFIQELAEKSIDFAFTGNMSYFPNVDAAVYFAKEVFPFVLAKHPSATVYFVGNNPSKKVRDLADNEHIFVTGFVDDIRYYLNRTKVFVGPLRSGSGIQNKILEAMSSSLPVVATSYGNAGIKAENGKQIIVSDNAEQFAAELLLLLTDEKRRQELGTNARTLVENKFSWEQRGILLESIYKQIVENPSNLTKDSL